MSVCLSWREKREALKSLLCDEWVFLSQNEQEIGNLKESSLLAKWPCQVTG